MGTRPGTGDGHPSRSARLWRCVSEEHPRPRRRRDAPMRIALGTNVACFSIFIRFPLSDSSCRPGESECRSSAPENLVDCGVSRSQGLRAAGCLKLPQEHHVCVLQVTTGERRPEIKRRLDSSLRLSLRAATLCTLEGSALGSATCRQHAGEARWRCLCVPSALAVLGKVLHSWKRPRRSILAQCHVPCHVPLRAFLVCVCASSVFKAPAPSRATSR